MHPYRESPALREPYRIAGLWVRVLLLVVLLWGGLVTVLSAVPRERELADLRADLAAGRVTYVIYKGHEDERGELREVRWSTGPLFWYRALRPWHDDRPYTMAALVADAAPDITDADVADVDPRPVLRKATDRDGRNGLFPAWPSTVPVPHGSWTVSVAWIATFIVMVGTARPRLGNRWAWFWLFTVGQIGAVMYLLSEPRSVWRGLGPQEPPPSRLGGGRGCVLALCLQFLVPSAVFGAGTVVPRLLDMLAGP
ncbi:hypothetical protein [Microtetraspora sp. NBRC 16547]|uniref:hypothetical protein n=1 Tax=Microtetraspora sp. NBRC 16547 TaxID=3030993 RepID=UPI0024A0A074|nr:hypothetical protein [Microtetraspora sp. NBRC 16547]GLW98575.1 hypothetical protein Misp02_26620 [Microtetraspora sp. NBRC 16547]